MIAKPPRQHVRREVGGLPIMRMVARRMGLAALFERFVRSHGNDLVPIVDTLMLLVYSLTGGKEPLYELPAWVAAIDERAIGKAGLVAEKFNDDRFGRALDRLYACDRASLMTELVMTVVRVFKLDLARIHNDSTTVKAHGKYPGKSRSGLQLKQGNSKDHRPDLKQLVFSLSLCADGGIPIHHKVYPGNRTDDTTHIETWNTLCTIAGRADFLYVADSKLCTDPQLHHVVSHGGRAVSIVPETWKEVQSFKATLRTTRKTKKEIWRRPKPNHEEEIEYFSVFVGDHDTNKRRYRIHWIYSSEKRKRDRTQRQERLVKAEGALTELNARVNTRNLKTQEAIDEAVTAILSRYQVGHLLAVKIGISREGRRVQIGRGRPGKKTQYEMRIRPIYTLTWLRDRKALQAEARADGVFPLLSTDRELSAKAALQAYKYQPRLEKRFCQFKSIHNAAPLLFKKIARIEANMFLFFIALMIQALIERQVRSQMVELGLDSLKIYPEDRDAERPTTSKILNVFERVSTYSIVENGQVVEEFKDELTDTQKVVLDCLGMSENDYWFPS